METIDKIMDLPNTIDSLRDAYDVGKMLATKYGDQELWSIDMYNDLWYGGHRDLLDDIARCPQYYNIMIRVGYDGHNYPQKVTAVRYGNLPESGISHNYADDRSERGVSVIAVLDDNDTIPEHGSFVQMMWGANRPLVKITGYLMPYFGSDGEKLLIGCKYVKN